MNLAIDCGNTSAKVGIFDHHKLVEKHTLDISGELEQFLKDRQEHHAIISTVSTDAGLIAAWARQIKSKIIFSPALPIPIRNLYATPSTLGVDRLAGACGAFFHFPGKDCLVVDAGTCLKLEFIDAAGNYHGGSISPGMKMRFDALHTFTARLPLVTATGQVDLTGNSTQSCIQSGVINGMIAEVNGMIASYQEKYPHLKVILCGGDAGFFENQLKASIFASPELVLIGLNSILIHNVNLQ